jgi:hypothetical protein
MQNVNVAPYLIKKVWYYMIILKNIANSVSHEAKINRYNP